MTINPDDYITEEHAKNVCLIGRSERTCRYITMSQAGWSCEKSTMIGKFLSQRADRMQQIPRGDNCPGRKPRYVGKPPQWLMKNSNENKRQTNWDEKPYSEKLMTTISMVLIAGFLLRRMVGKCSSLTAALQQSHIQNSLREKLMLWNLLANLSDG